MRNKFVTLYGVAALIILTASVAWFIFSVSSATRQGKKDAEQSFVWISREAASKALTDGFMTDSFIQAMTKLCRQSRLLSAVVISTPSGSVFAWPENSESIQYDLRGKPVIADASMFMRVHSAALDIGDGASGAVILTAVFYSLHPDTVFSAARNSFFVILALTLITLIVIFASSTTKERVEAVEVTGVPSVAVVTVQDTLEGVSLTQAPEAEIIDDTAVSVSYGEERDNPSSSMDEDPVLENQTEIPDSDDAESDNESLSPQSREIPTDNGHDRLFSPLTGIGWEHYLKDRLDAELVRAASSEQDLSLTVLRVSGLLHTDLLARKIAQALLDAFKFKDMVFEYGPNGFAGIAQNVNLDQAMKKADEVYAAVDSILMEMSYDGQITIGITTRTARLLDAQRMIDEATSAARKAEEEPNLPIVAFRANPEKYRNFVAENS